MQLLFIPRTMNSDKAGDYNNDKGDFLELGDENDILPLTLVAFPNLTWFVMLMRCIKRMMMMMMIVMVIFAYSVLLTGIKG